MGVPASVLDFARCSSAFLAASPRDWAPAGATVSRSTAIGRLETRRLVMPIVIGWPKRLIRLALHLCAPARWDEAPRPSHDFRRDWPLIGTPAPRAGGCLPELSVAVSRRCLDRSTLRDYWRLTSLNPKVGLHGIIGREPTDARSGRGARESPRFSSSLRCVHRPESRSFPSVERRCY